MFPLSTISAYKNDTQPQRIIHHQFINRLQPLQISANSPEMKLYQVVGILIIFNLAFSDCYPSLKAKAWKMKIRGVIGTGHMATKDSGQQSGKKSEGLLYAKEER